MFPTINLGPLAIQTRGLILLASVWLATEAAERGAKRLGLRGDHIYNLALIAGLCGLIGARLGYVLEHFAIYQNYPAQIVALDLNTLSAGWGAAAAVLAAYLYAQRKGIANRLLLDALTPGFGVLAGGWALANLASGDAYGSPSSLPWSIELWGEARHPSQIYEFIAVVLIGVIVLKIDRVFDGLRFGLFVAAYAAARLILEAFRGDSMVTNGVRTIQVWSLIVVVVALLVMRRWAMSQTDLSTGEREA